MTNEFDRRTVLRTALLAGTVGAATPSVRAQPGVGEFSAHALDTYLGRPASGIRIDISRKEGNTWKLLHTVTADRNGRVGEVMRAETMTVGRYELLFYVEDYYREAGVKLTDPAYLDTVPVRMAIIDTNQSYHVPLYFSPWSILSYRGS